MYYNFYINLCYYLNAKNGFNALKVYAVDERHLFIRNFRYDGTGPDAYFWVGSDARPSPKGRVVPYPPMDTRYEIFNVFFTNETLTI